MRLFHAHRLLQHLPRRMAAVLAVAGVLGAFAAPLVTDTRPAIAGHKDMGALDDSAHQAYLRQRMRDIWLASWMMMAEQFTANMMHQMWILGQFLDAKHQLETQQLFRELLDQAHKDYQPSDQMCRFGTNIRSLAATDEKRQVNAQVLSTLMMNRELLTSNTSAGMGPAMDKLSRIRQFKLTYCDIHDNNDRLAKMCRLYSARDGQNFTRGAPDGRSNRDIDFMRNVGSAYTLDIDFTDTTLTNDEEDVIALSKNLFANDVFSVIGDKLLMQEFNKDEYQDVRSIIAMRGIVRNSFGHIVGDRARGTASSGPFLKRIVEEMGVPSAEVDQFLGEDPSYFAQMELLTRKMYQNPTFYAALYTQPTNIDRTAAAMQAIKLMSDRDRFDGAIRREMLLSTLLELKVRTAEDILVNEMQNFTPFKASP